MVVLHYISFFAIFIPFLALGAPEVIYDSSNDRSLREFQLFLEGPVAVGERAHLIQTQQGLTSSPTQLGGFTLYKFADLKRPNFNLKFIFEIPQGITYLNSGIYFLYTDPTRPLGDEASHREKRLFQEAIAKARERASKYGPGPYEADFFARELQIIAGSASRISGDNYGAGAFYGIVPVTGETLPDGRQRTTPFELMPGDTYEMVIEGRDRIIKTYLRSLAYQQVPVLVSEFKNFTREMEPILGGSPIAVLLQMYPLNGQDSKGPIFKHISIDRNL
jgi:hypothetical protein